MVRMSLWTTRIAAGLLACGAVSGHAAQVCELNGQSVNPANVDTTAGKSGVMRCREAEGGPVVREEELREGRFMGIARTWYPSGQLKRVVFRNDNGREEAVAEFTTEGKLVELRCAPRAQLVPHADDARWCGHSGAPEAVALYGTSGAAASSVTYERGVLRARETLWPNGKPREQITITGQTHIERTFAEDGVKRREIESIRTPSDGTSRPRGFTTRDSEYHESGKLVRERRWAPDTRFLVVEAQWYLNGQPREKIERVTAEGTTVMRETRFHDNGKPAFEGDYRIVTREPRLPTGVHKRFDVAGHLLAETYHDTRGRITREREFDAQGKVVRDDNVFEDGSRKANSR